MADTVNPVISDAVAQTNLKVLGDSPAIATSNLYLMNAQALGLAAQNAVFAQQQANIIHQAATVQGVTLIYSAVTLAQKRIAQARKAEALATAKALLEALEKRRRQEEQAHAIPGRGSYP